MAENRILTRALRHPKPKCETDLFKILHKIGNHLTGPEVKLLTTVSGFKIDESTRARIKNGRDFMDALVKCGQCDESDFESVFELLRKIRRHDLLHMLHTRGKAQVASDPVEEYLSNQIPQSNDPARAGCSRSNQPLRIREEAELPSSLSRPSTSSHGQVHFKTRTTDELPTKRQRRSTQHQLKPVLSNTNSTDKIYPPSTSKQKYTCDVQLRVRAEYCDYETILSATVASNKQDPIERQSDCFNQANIILRSRDLGHIVCDIKFSEITYLDAFWRDYLNGSLLEALKGVVITETLKQAAGNESIKLLVHVNETDYEKGRAILLKNLNKVD